MATTGKVRSNKIGIYFAPTLNSDNDTDVSGTYGDSATDESDTFELVACATSGSLSASTEIIEATTKDNDGQREILIGGVTWNMSVEGMIQFDTSASVQGSGDLFDLWAAKTKFRVAWTTGENGDYMYYGDAYITQIEESAGLNEVATFSATLEGDGALTKALIDTTNLTFNRNDV